MQSRDPDAASAPLVGLAERYEPGVAPAHAHARAQLMYAVQGSMTVIAGQGSWVLPPSRALWLPSGVTHSLKVRRYAELRTLYLDEKAGWLGETSAPRVLQVGPLMRELILAAIDAPWSYPPDSPSQRLARVVCDRIAFMPSEPVHLPDLIDPRAKRLAAIYYANPAERRRLVDLAGGTGASARTLERLFVSETGLSVGAWTKRLRLMFALENLSDGSSVGDAAFAVGFDNPSSFIAAFKLHFGVTPARYFA